MHYSGEGSYGAPTSVLLWPGVRLEDAMLRLRRKLHVPAEEFQKWRVGVYNSRLIGARKFRNLGKAPPYGVSQPPSRGAALTASTPPGNGVE